MVAYHFRRRFVPAIEAGTKTGTIRTAGRRRHARPGEVIQLETGSRSRRTRIATPICRAVHRVTLWFGPGSPWINLWPDGVQMAVIDLDAFARADGFEDLEAMARYWRDAHDVEVFTGVRIEWLPLAPPASAAAAKRPKRDPAAGVVGRLEAGEILVRTRGVEGERWSFANGDTVAPAAVRSLAARLVPRGDQLPGHPAEAAQTWGLGRP